MRPCLLKEIGNENEMACVPTDHPTVHTPWRRQPLHLLRMRSCWQTLPQSLHWFSALVGAYARSAAERALAPDAVMLAEMRAPAFLAPALTALVGAYPRASAVYAPAPLAVVLADARSPAVPARVLDALVLAYLPSPARWRR